MSVLVAALKALDEIANEGSKNFAIVIDEAHSSQGAKTSAAMSQVLGAPIEEDAERVESHDHAIQLKAEIMVDHFHERVVAAGKIGGHAWAMVNTSGIERAIQYFHAFKAYVVERKSPYQAIVAFSGEHEYGGAKVTEASLNGFPSDDIAGKI